MRLATHVAATRPSPVEAGATGDSELHVKVYKPTMPFNVYLRLGMDTIVAYYCAGLCKSIQNVCRSLQGYVWGPIRAIPPRDADEEHRPGAHLSRLKNASDLCPRRSAWGV